MSCQSRRKLVNQRISGLPVCPYLWNYGQRGFKAFHQLGKTITTPAVTPRPESASAAPSKNTVKIVRLPAAPPICTTKATSAGGMAFTAARHCFPKSRGLLLKLLMTGKPESISFSVARKAPFASDTPFCAGRCPPASREAPSGRREAVKAAAVKSGL